MLEWGGMVVLEAEYNSAPRIYVHRFTHRTHKQVISAIEPIVSAVLGIRLVQEHFELLAYQGYTETVEERASNERAISIRIQYRNLHINTPFRRHYLYIQSPTPIQGIRLSPKQHHRSNKSIGNLHINKLPASPLTPDRQSTPQNQLNHILNTLLAFLPVGRLAKRNSCRKT